MQFPNTPATRFTEWQMAQWKETHPTASTSEYNREYERVYEAAVALWKSGQALFIAHVQKTVAEHGAICHVLGLPMDQKSLARRMHKAEKRVKTRLKEYERRGPRHTKPKRRR